MIAEILRSFDLVLDDARQLLADVADEQMAAQPVADINPPTWIIGHIVYSCQMIGGEVGAEPWLPEDWTKLFATGSTCAHYSLPTSGIPPYHFSWIKDPDGRTHLQHFDEVNFPGKLPKPVTLVGPADGSSAGTAGATLECQVSENSVAYQLLFGEDRDNPDVVFESASPPSVPTGPLPPGRTFYWTIRSRDSFGTTIHADMRTLLSDPGLPGDFNANGHVDQADGILIQAATGTTWGHPGFILAADFDGNGLVSAADCQAWQAYFDCDNNPNKMIPMVTASRTHVTTVP